MEHDIARVPSLELEKYSSFRSAQLLLAFSVASNLKIEMKSTERVAIYDFFTANPFAVLDGSDTLSRRDATRLELVGYSRGQLSYASLGHRFLTRQESVRFDLASLVARSLVEIGDEAYLLTKLGGKTADRLHSAYADAYRLSAEIVLSRLCKMGDRLLRENTSKWAGTHWLALDLFGDVTDIEVETL